MSDELECPQCGGNKIKKESSMDPANEKLVCQDCGFGSDL